MQLRVKRKKVRDPELTCKDLTDTFKSEELTVFLQRLQDLGLPEKLAALLSCGSVSVCSQVSLGVWHPFEVLT